MENMIKVPSKIIEVETSIKLLQYLKRKKIIDEGMHNFCSNKLIHKIELEKSKIDNDYLSNDTNYKILT